MPRRPDHPFSLTPDQIKSMGKPTLLTPAEARALGIQPYRPEDPSDTRDYPLNESAARELGLAKQEVAGHPAADAILAEIINHSIDITTPAGREAFVAKWETQCPDIPMPCVADKTDYENKGNYWYLTQLSLGKIISSTEDDIKIAAPNFTQSEFLWIDQWKEEDHDSPTAATSHQSKFHAELLGNPSTVNIEREALDAALWTGDPAFRLPTAKHIALLTKLSLDSAKFEFRCIRQDEYARLAKANNWGQKNLWTNFDQFFLGGVDDRRGLIGGYRGYGGPSNVGYYSRDFQDVDLAVRLVLSRKQV